MIDAASSIFYSPIQWNSSGDSTALFSLKYEKLAVGRDLPLTAACSSVFSSSQQNDMLSLVRPGLNKLLAQINRVMGDDEEYDAEFLRPTSYAGETARSLIMQAGGMAGGSFPPAVIYPDGNGGIRIEWAKPPKRLHLVISSCSETGYYLYEQDGNAFKTMNNASPRFLENRLRRLNDEHLPTFRL